MGIGGTSTVLNCFLLCDFSGKFCLEFLLQYLPLGDGSELITRCAMQILLKYSIRYKQLLGQPYHQLSITTNIHFIRDMTAPHVNKINKSLLSYVDPPTHAFLRLSHFHFCSVFLTIFPCLSLSVCLPIMYIAHSQYSKKASN